eukprot:FR736060.1.p1 GENE.FR736060.1~~FR736060.1.p1  ORF type:complete len:308 (+),score=14.40 FR736060.1:76-924(+)
MEIPAHLASRYPYYYDGTTTGPEQTEEESKLPNPKLGWNLTLVSSEPVKMSHDVAKERALAAVAYSWEDSQPGRADQATAVRTLYLSEKSSEEVADGLEARRSGTLGEMVDPQIESTRVTRRVDLPPFKVRQPESSGEHIVLDDAALAVRAEKCAEVITSSKENMEGVDNENIQYLASLKTQFAAQSTSIKALRKAAVDDYTAVIRKRSQYRQSCESQFQALNVPQGNWTSSTQPPRRSEENRRQKNKEMISTRILPRHWRGVWALWAFNKAPAPAGVATGP